MYTTKEKKSKNTIHIKVEQVHLPSNVHKYGALKNKSQVFDDRRFKKPKYKKNYMED